MEEYGFDQETITEILALDFKDALETAYSYITSAGEDADQILAELFNKPCYAPKASRARINTIVLPQYSNLAKNYCYLGSCLLNIINTGQQNSQVIIFN